MARRAQKREERKIDVGKLVLAPANELKTAERMGFDEAKAGLPRRRSFYAMRMYPDCISQLRFAYEKGYAQGLSRGGAAPSP